MCEPTPSTTAVSNSQTRYVQNTGTSASSTSFVSVNDVPDAVELLPDGQVVTVDGYLGMASIMPVTLSRTAGTIPTGTTAKVRRFYPRCPIWRPR